MSVRRFQVMIHDRVLDWLADECHPQREVRLRVMQDFVRIFDVLEIAGQLTGKKQAKRLQGVNNLWEARVNDPTGAYRVFFGYGRTRAGALTRVGAAHFYRKTENALPVHVRRTAELRVVKYLEEIDG